MICAFIVFVCHWTYWYSKHHFSTAMSCSAHDRCASKVSSLKVVAICSTSPWSLAASSLKRGASRCVSARPPAATSVRCHCELCRGLCGGLPWEMSINICQVMSPIYRFHRILDMWGELLLLEPFFLHSLPILPISHPLVALSVKQTVPKVPENPEASIGFYRLWVETVPSYLRSMAHVKMTMTPTVQTCPRSNVGSIS